MQDVLLEADADLLLRLRVLARQQVAERPLVLVADRPVEAGHGTRGLAHLTQLLQGQPGSLGDFILGRRTTELRRELSLCAGHPLLTLGDVHGDPDRAGLVRHPTRSEEHTSELQSPY